MFADPPPTHRAALRPDEFFAVSAPDLTLGQTPVASNIDPVPGATFVTHLIWVLSEGLNVASEAGNLMLPGLQAVVQYEIACKGGELTSIARNNAAIGYGRQVWTVQIKETGASATEILRSALAPICRM